MSLHPYDNILMGLDMDLDIGGTMILPTAAVASFLWHSCHTLHNYNIKIMYANIKTYTCTKLDEAINLLGFKSEHRLDRLLY
jgi:hypothetical protein